MVKFVLLILGIAFIFFLWLVHNAMTKPTYNKIHNVWEEDEESKQTANLALGIIIVVAFLLGLMF